MKVAGIISMGKYIVLEIILMMIYIYIYVGSSCQPLSKRMAHHKTSSKSEKKKQIKLYKKMNEYGFDHFYIELYEEYPCENVEQSRRRGETIRTLKPILNKKIAGRTRQEWYDENDGYNERYYQKKESNPRRGEPKPASHLPLFPPIFFT